MNRTELFEYLKDESRVLRTEALEKAFRAIDRADFVDKDYKAEAYEDYPLPIGFGQTISQPTTVAFMLELLDVRPGEKVLDVGSGSGFSTALLSQLVGEKGFVHGVEVVPELVSLGQRNLAAYGFKNAAIEGSGKEFGLARKGPYDKILVSAAAQEVPEELLLQLKPGGTLVLPVGNSLVRIQGLGNGNFETKEFPGFAFVPLQQRH